MRVAVTGATGAIGGRVAQLTTDLAPRLVVRDPSRAPAGDVAAATFGDRGACRAAFSGVDVLLLVSAGESADRLDQHRTAIEAAAEAGVSHVVYTSFLGAASDAKFTLARDHGATEEMLRASGMAWTFLRDNFYADILVDFAGPDRIIRGPAGDGRCGFVARVDVAAVAAAVLRDPSPYEGQVLTLTGPESLTLTEAAEIMTEVTGQAFRFHNETVDEAYASRAHYGAPEWQLDAWVSTYTAIASGSLDLVSPDVERVLGRRATSLAQVVEHGPTEPPGQPERAP